MPKERFSKEKFLFEHFRRNLIGVRDSEPHTEMLSNRDDVVICPLCLREFTVDDIDRKVLIGEHAPLDKLGGTVDTLTCAKCNHGHGSALDTHLVDFIRNIDAFTGNGPSLVDGEVYMQSGNKFSIEFRVTESNEWQLFSVPNPHASNPESIIEFTRSVETTNLKFDLRLQLANLRRARLSLIRTGYIIAFKYLGYSFLGSLTLQVFRDQFNNPDSELIPVSIAFLDFDCPDEFLGINVISQPANLKSFLIVFDVKAKKSISRRIAVMLPGPNPYDFGILDNLADRPIANISFKHFDISFEDKLRFPLISHYVWNSVDP